MCEPTLIATGISWLASGAGAVGLTGTAATLTGASTAAAALTGAQALSLGASVLGTGFSAASAYQQSSVQKQVASNNAILANQQADDARRRGELDAQAVHRKGEALKSTQRSVMAARGLDLSEGTAQDLQDQTDFFTATDVGTTRYNAAREASALRSRSNNFTAEAAGINPFLSAGGSLLTSAGGVADKWYAYTGKKG